MSQRPLRLGTRRSLLARTQSTAVARALERAHPGLTVELVGIDTRGDRITDIPLSQVDGKEFFTAEIDAALRAGEVDLTVHSYKDLSLERPSGLRLAAVPRRENPRDIVIFAADVPEHLARGGSLRIGSSSPRRQALVPGFLERALPGNPLATNSRITLCELRGNVDTRLRRLREPRGSERALDGVVLAFAGLSRLAEDQELGAGAVLRELLTGLPRMLLPLTQCPAAPAQGALAIECRSDDPRTIALLTAIDDLPTRVAVDAERALLAVRGGGCQQRFGATQVQIEGLGDLLYVREADEKGLRPAELRWQAPEPPHPAVPAWDGSVQPPPAIETIAGASDECARRLAHTHAAFIAHPRALPELPAAEVNRCPHLWVSGTETWFALASRGVWVEGCAESLGFAALKATLNSTLLALPPLHEWLALTHLDAARGWGEVQALATYRHLANGPGDGAPPADASPAGAAQVWWHSGVQFERWRGKTSADCQHACGPGKTAEVLRRGGVAHLNVFPSVRHWREWLRS
jgi:hydroxymethylbilane synthase